MQPVAGAVGETVAPRDEPALVEALRRGSEPAFLALVLSAAAARKALGPPSRDALPRPGPPSLWPAPQGWGFGSEATP